MTPLPYFLVPTQKEEDLKYKSEEGTIVSKPIANQNVWVSRVKYTAGSIGASLGMLLRICWWSIGSLINAGCSLMLVALAVMVLKPVSMWSYFGTAVLLLATGLIPGAIAALFQSMAFRSVGIFGRYSWFCIVTVSLGFALSMGAVVGELVWLSVPDSAGMVLGIVSGLFTWGVVQAILPTYLLHLAGVTKAWLNMAVSGVGAILLIVAYMTLYNAIGTAHSLMIGAFVFSAMQLLVLEHLLRPTMQTAEANTRELPTI